MRPLLTSFTIPLSLLRLALVLAAPALLTQCQTVPSSAMASLTGEIGTPQHSLPKHEYPFDDSGKYREDWVPSIPRNPVN